MSSTLRYAVLSSMLSRHRGQPQSAGERGMSRTGGTLSTQGTESSQPRVWGDFMIIGSMADCIGHETRGGAKNGKTLEAYIQI